MSTVRLAEDQLERLAVLVAERLQQPHAATQELVSAGALADTLGVSVKYVYEHATELGALTLSPAGDGKRPRLRFDPATARAALSSLAGSRSQTAKASAEADSEPRTPRRRRRLPNGLPPAGSILRSRGEGA